MFPSLSCSFYGILSILFTVSSIPTFAQTAERNTSKDWSSAQWGGYFAQRSPYVLPDGRPLLIDIDSTTFSGSESNPRKIDDGKPVRVLFIGNSMIYTNDVPGMFRTVVSAATRRSVVTGMVALPGATLTELWHSVVARQIIAKYPWDYVVLQGLPSARVLTAEESLKEHRGMSSIFDANETGNITRAFAVDIRKKGAQPILVAAPQGFHGNSVFESSIDTIYTTAGAAIQAPVAHIAMAPFYMLKAGLWIPSTCVLHLPKDDTHPSRAGAYWFSLHLYAAIFNRSPVGLPHTMVPELSDSVVSLLQHGAQISLSADSTKESRRP